MKKTSILLVLVLLLAIPMTASAQEPRIVILGSTVSLPEGLEQAVIDTLSANPPNDTRFYVITYVQPESAHSWFVCVAATSTDVPEQFDMSENMVWFGTLRINQILPEEWQGEFITAGRLHVPKVASVRLADKNSAGGGAYVRLPFQAGANAMYGVLGVHETTLDGMVFVDLLGGSNMGTNIMSDRVFSSASGIVDGVCKDSNNVGIRVESGDWESYYYLHLVDNDNLYFGKSFTVGELIGRLKHGSFSNGTPVSCGGASQQDTNYHVHWGFYPRYGMFQAAQWILDVNTQNWSDGTHTVKPGQILSNMGTFAYMDSNGDPSNDSPTGGNINGFWDLIIAGYYAVAGTIVHIFPQHEANGLFVAISTGAGVALRIIYTIGDTVLNLNVLFAVVISIIALEAIRPVIMVLKFTIDTVIKMIK